MTTQTVFSDASLAAADRRETGHTPATEAARVERTFLVTVGLLAGLEVGLLAFWLIG
ncbi:hypothetical protein JMJ56_15980 [Belnapia sp. T18]|uniref:Uncharacterized protein n=1 Tax=Belnapia arida TaxID=2804533 RepID=A0ABS1U4B5_9PROT|nr:hypothetical protein [Belnapia arida]MBL6079519.1 hypothetical protein [Belnapia arida]